MSNLDRMRERTALWQELKSKNRLILLRFLEVQGARKMGNVIAHLHMRVKNSTKVFNKRRAFDFNIIKDEGEMFKVLIVSSRRCDEKLCFIRVHHHLVTLPMGQI